MQAYAGVLKFESIFLCFFVVLSSMDMLSVGMRACRTTCISVKHHYNSESASTGAHVRTQSSRLVAACQFPPFLVGGLTTPEQAMSVNVVDAGC